MYNNTTFEKRQVETMIGITKSILENNLSSVFTSKDLLKLCPDDNIRYCQVNRAINNGEIIRLRKGFYTLSKIYRKKPIDSEVLSQKIDNTSYVSMVSALRNHNWIPETVYLCTCVTMKKSKKVDCTLFGYDYRNIKQKNFLKGVKTVNYYGENFLQATPLKAICDYISWRNLNWTSTEPLIDSLRIEEENLEELTSKDFDELQGNYPDYPNTERFIAGVRKELSL